MIRNNLFLNRLAVYTQKNEIAYDEKFHKGINIIRGDNSSGKSTITQFIFYALGGSFNDWVKEAKFCSLVIAEVEMNGAILVLKREINISEHTNKANPIEPIYIYWGSFEDSQKAASNEWNKFGYNTTLEKKSFSNVFFENLDIPIVKGENNITFHQILRLLYVDQDSPTSSLFFYEQFDTQLTRETVADLLLGAYSQTLYESRQRILEVRDEIDDIRKEVKVIKQYIPNELDLYPAHIITKIENKEKEIASFEDELLRYKDENKTVRYTKTAKLEFEKLNEESLVQRERVNSLENSIQLLKNEIDDSKYFISVLEDKIKAIRNSILTREFLEEYPLEYCPECLTKLHKIESEGKCKLCKEVVDSSTGITQARKIEQELSFQIKESKSLMVLRERKLLEANSSYEAEKLKLTALQSRVNAALKDVKSYREERIDSLYVEKGFAEGEMLQLNTLLERAQLFQSLLSRQRELEDEEKRLQVLIDGLTSTQEAKKKETNQTIEKKALYLLNNDLRRQEDFIAAKEFNIDYRNNIAFISDKDAKYSASSNFYLKTTARFAIFLASLENNQMRYPRFILCDNMEDKGIEEKRAQNFQRIVVTEAEKHSSNTYQMIFTTSFIAPELNNEKYVVGEYYSKDKPSLKNV
ncbi:hypothetical protein KTO58_19280 [Chitinophaga pendula]|uniref:AAA family ATPase n=1 Tax=Chitinophaga TaxID=79328 RepID=UPI000BAFD7F2|nr:MULTISPECIES: AAA family ATPase [Chitinophaga]ASZ11186.1 hypothetical protein CK934_09530 [Chitinophaga sp. MD30]UCJ05818.1 hypothetical protein KTO58_19280 [Chitinophaga pendula]